MPPDQNQVGVEFFCCSAQVVCALPVQDIFRLHLVQFQITAGIILRVRLHF
jgi:hypothetical protein